MAVVKPLYVDSGNLKEMDSTKVNEIVDQCVYQYSLSPSVALSVVSSGGSISQLTTLEKSRCSINECKFIFQVKEQHRNHKLLTVTYDKVTETRTAGSPTSDTGKTWAVYYNSSGQIQAMSLTDVKDTFLHPAIDLLASGSTGTQQGGTYHVSTSTSVSGSTEVSGSNTNIFTDTRADTVLIQQDQFLKHKTNQQLLQITIYIELLVLKFHILNHIF